ncbi:MAG: lipopolysaccharide assembly protein LapA domain-containing protein [Bacillota bacterium]|jgi:putative membrane protein
MLVVAMVFLLLVVVFAVQNAQLVSIMFFGWTLSMNLALVVLGSVSVGVLVGAVWVWFRQIGVRARVKELSKELAEEREKSCRLDKALQELIVNQKGQDASGVQGIASK